jgi:hypothetical protein
MLTEEGQMRELSIEERVKNKKRMRKRVKDVKRVRR